MLGKIQNRLFRILEVAEKGDRASKACDVGLMVLIAANVLAVILESVSSLSIRFDRAFAIFEAVSVIIFTCEYVARVWVCCAGQGYRGAVRGRLKFVFSPMALIDLAAILPFYLPAFLSVDMRVLRALRLLRLLRMLKLGRYSRAMQDIAAVFRAKKEELVITISVVLVLLVLTSSAMYYVENNAQPEAFSSIPAAMWWAVAALTTVGYGDAYPVTILGKLLGAGVAILGIGMFALPAGILASGFTEVFEQSRGGNQTCPHCGKDISTPSEASL